MKFKEIKPMSMTVVGRCKDCDCWGPNVAWGEPRGTETMRICNSDKLGESMDVPSDTIDGLQYQYDEGGVIQTGPEFGCVHFTPKGD